MKELAEALKHRAGLQMRQGVVTAVTGSTCSVLVGGSDVPVDEVQHLNSCQPIVGDVVWITSDGADLWIVGTHGDPPPIDPARLPTFDTYFTDSDPVGAPAAVTGFEGAASLAGVVLSWDLPPEALWRSWEVYEGGAADFAPVTPILTTTQTVVDIARDPGAGPLWYKVRALNTRAEASDYAVAGPFTIPLVEAPDLGEGSVHAAALAAGAVDLEAATVTGQLLAAKLADNAVTQAKIAASAISMNKLAAGILPTRAVTSLPALPDAEYPEGSTAILTMDGKLYTVRRFT